MVQLITVDKKMITLTVELSSTSQDKHGLTHHHCWHLEYSGVLLRHTLGKLQEEAKTNSLWRVQNQHLRFWLDRRIVLSLYYCTANYLDSWGCQPRCESIWIQVRQEEFPEASSRKSQALRSKEPVGATGAAPEEVFISSEGKWQCG